MGEAGRRDYLSFLLGCPTSYLTTTDSNSCLLFASNSWLASLQQSERVPESFPTHPSYTAAEVTALLEDQNYSHPQWCLITVQVVDRQGGEVISSSRPSQSPALNLTETVDYVEKTNFSGGRLKNHQQNSPKTEAQPALSGIPWVQELITQIRRIWGREIPLIQCSEAEQEIADSLNGELEEEGEKPSVVPLLAVLFDQHHLVFLGQQPPASLAQLLNFSPAAIQGCQTKILFLLFQLIQLVHSFEKLGLSPGLLSLHQLHLSPTLLVLARNSMTATTSPLPPSLPAVNVKSSKLQRQLNAVLRKIAGEEGLEATLDQAMHLWIQRDLSNLDYLLFLNYLAGRRFGQPNHHPVVPWVTDFSSPESLRNLTKSKFRLTKGDEALERTFEAGAMGVLAPHHVTDVLSEITYYTYLSRRTSREVLQRTVRPSWVPAEYPGSVNRLYQWSPDEAIPELYTDPSIFFSIHEDLPDFELVPWAPTPEKFITWHRKILESEEVSSHLHTWIDLTFGYRLSGSAAVRSKNVCLSLVDGHTEPKIGGAVQLFNIPHPTKILQIPGAQDQDGQRGYVSEGELEEEEEETAKLGGTFNLEADCDPLLELHRLEAQALFSGNACNVVQMKPFQNPEPHKSKRHQARRILGCLAWELIAPHRLPILGQYASLEEREAVALAGFKAERRSLAPLIRQLLETLLCPDEENTIRADVLSESSRLLHPFLTDCPLSPFFPILQATLAGVENLHNVLDIASSSSGCEEMQSTLADAQVNLVAQHITPLLPSITKEEAELVIPLVSQLLASSKTAVLAAWTLFDSVAAAIGPEATATHFLAPISALYCSGSPTAKHLKLYHRSFLIILIVRFRLGPFLQHFTNFLIEAVGGYNEMDIKQEASETSGKDREIKEEDDIEPQVSETEFRREKSAENFAEGEVFAFDNNEDLACKGGSEDDEMATVVSSVAQRLLWQGLEEEGRGNVEAGWLDQASYTKVDDNWTDPSRSEATIARVAAESVAWLAQRLGPVLAARHLARNLLRMLGLCYLSPGALKVAPGGLPEQKIRVSCSAVAGDRTVEPVLGLLTHLAALYGEGIVLSQYFPYCFDLASLAKQRIHASLAASLLGCLAIMQRVVPLLSDTVLMQELPNLLAHLLLPLLQVATSRRAVFSGGATPRTLLLLRLLDLTYLVGLRIGEEMARTHLTPLVTGYFSAFDKLHLDNEKDPALETLAHVLSPSTAYSSYVAFYNLLGGAFLDKNINNIERIKSVCKRFQQSLESTVHRPLSCRELAGTQLTNISSASCGSGNMILVEEDQAPLAHPEDRLLISKPTVDSTRQLRGNWLAYWEHEVGRDARDTTFNLKQIKLQTFAGHQGGVKSLSVLDNENSFLSGGKDRTVRLWSIRNSGEGESSVNAQSVFSGHKKSVFSVNYIETKGFVASCDGTLLVWDPFVCSTVQEYEAGKGVTYCVLRSLPSPSALVVTATSEGMVRLVDTRSQSPGSDLKVSYGAAGLIRSMAVNKGGVQLAVGHSSGYISLLDLRTGRLRNGFKAHDGEVLTLTTISDQHFVSTSLDQTASGWRWEDGRLAANLRAPPEPVHCVVAHKDSEVIMGSTANRLTVQKAVETSAGTSVNRLRIDLLRGHLSSMACLSLNQQLLMGTDQGSIHLLC